MTEYRQGHVKRNSATGEIALRTVFADDADNPQMARLAWLIADSTIGARNAFTSDVDDWADLYVPPAPAPAAPPESEK